MDDDDAMTWTSEPDAVLRYAAHDDGLVDVHLPPGPRRPRPLVFYVHGGFWRHPTDRTSARPVVNALAEQGYVVAVPEYRRVGGAGGWPTTADDVQEALTSLPDLLSGLGVETTTTTVVGHSAGGHLALWLASEPHQLDRVVGLAPVADLRAAVELGMGGSATVDFLGGTPEEIPETYDAADPAVRLVSRPKADVVVLHGVEDSDVPVESSRGLKRRFDWVDYRELPGIDHLEVADPSSAAWSTLLDAVRGGTLEA